MDNSMKEDGRNNGKWPTLQEPYKDEYGLILPEVYEVARKLWPREEGFVLLKLGDSARGQSIMFRAISVVSQVISQKPDHITHLDAFLKRTFRRLVLKELKIENGHREKVELAANDPVTESLMGNHEEEPDRKILILQIIRMMHEPTRHVFELLCLGHTYDEIAGALNQPANGIRSRFSKQIEKIRKQLRG